jgi:hypothetical protein
MPLEAAEVQEDLVHDVPLTLSFNGRRRLQRQAAH